MASEAGSNRRAFFKYVNSKLKVRPDVSTLIGENGELVHDEKEMANIYNRYFHASFNRPVDGEVLPDRNPQCEQIISELDVNVDLVRKKLEGLNRFKGCDPDNIHPHVLRETAQSISLPITMIYRESLRTGETPEDWRKANVTPIFKKGDRRPNKLQTY